MSADASAGAGDGFEPGEGYDEMRQELVDMIDWIDDKMENGRVRSPEHARARQGYLRLKIRAIDEWRKLKETGDLEELTERIERIEKQREDGDAPGVVA